MSSSGCDVTITIHVACIVKHRNVHASSACALLFFESELTYFDL